MPIFTPCEDNLKSTSDKYRKGSERAEVSKPLEFRAGIYKEIVYKKKSFLSKPEITGRVIVDENGQAVKDKNQISRMANYFFYMETLFDGDYRKRISRTVLPEGELKREAEEYQKMIFTLEALEREGMDGINTVTEIINALPENKVENNKLIESFLNKTKDYEESVEVFDSSIIDELKFLYKETLMQNFKRVRIINRGRDYYDNIKRAITGSGRRKMRGLGKYVFMGSTRLETTINNFIRTLKIYEPIIDMTENQYSQYISKMDFYKIRELESTVRF